MTEDAGRNREKGERAMIARWLLILIGAMLFLSGYLLGFAGGVSWAM